MTTVYLQNKELIVSFARTEAAAVVAVSPQAELVVWHSTVHAVSLALLTKHSKCAVSEQSQRLGALVGESIP